MTYQPALFDDATMQDRSHVLSGHLRLPAGMKRGDCVDGAAARERGEQSCPFLTCKYHLVPELVKLRPKGAESAMVRRLSGEIKSSCVLDLTCLPGEEWSSHSSMPQDHNTIADALGIDRQAIENREGRALVRFRRLLRNEAQNEAIMIERTRMCWSCREPKPRSSFSTTLGRCRACDAEGEKTEWSNLSND